MTITLWLKPSRGEQGRSSRTLVHARAIVPLCVASPPSAWSSSTVERVWSIGSRVWHHRFYAPW
eukprot:285485-Alexandrium_andersonii.AAC.1